MNVYEGKPEFDKIHTSKLITIQILFSHVFTIQNHESKKNLKKFIPKIFQFFKFIKFLDNLLNGYRISLIGYFERIFMGFVPVICSKFPSEMRPIMTL